MAAGTYGLGSAISALGGPGASWLTAWCGGVYRVAMAAASLAGGWTVKGMAINGDGPRKGVAFHLMVLWRGYFQLLMFLEGGYLYIETGCISTVCTDLLDEYLYMRHWVVTAGGTTPATDSLIFLDGEYFFQAVLGLTSCHDWVVSRMVLWCSMSHWIAQMVLSVSWQGIHVGHCAGTTRASCCRRVLYLGRSVSTEEAGDVLSLLIGNPTGASRYSFKAPAL